MFLSVDDEIIGSTAISGVIGMPHSSTVMALGVNPIGDNPQANFFNGKIYSVSVTGYDAVYRYDGYLVNVLKKLDEMYANNKEIDFVCDFNPSRF